MNPIAVNQEGTSGHAPSTCYRLDEQRADAMRIWGETPDPSVQRFEELASKQEEQVETPVETEETLAEEQRIQMLERLLMVIEGMLIARTIMSEAERRAEEAVETMGFIKNGAGAWEEVDLSDSEQEDLTAPLCPYCGVHHN